MKLDDQQLDQLLSDVPVPDTLKQQLHKVPDLNPTSDLPEQRRRSGWMTAALVSGGLIAASLVVMISLYFNTNSPVTVKPSDPDPLTPEQKAGVAQKLEEIEMATLEIQQQLRHLELQRKRQQLEQLRASTLPVVALQPRDQTSLILSLSQQAALEWGADSTSVRDELIQVSRDYPNSLGSEKADQILRDLDK